MGFRLMLKAGYPMGGLTSQFLTPDGIDVAPEVKEDASNTLPNNRYQNVIVDIKFKTSNARYNDAAVQILTKDAFNLFDPNDAKKYINNDISVTVGFRVERGRWEVGDPVPTFEDEDATFDDYEYATTET